MQLILYRGRSIIIIIIIIHLPERSRLHEVIFQNVRSNLCHLESYHWQHFIHLSQ